MGFGELTIRYVDIPITLLTVAICMWIAVKHEVTVSREFKQLIFPFLPFFLYAGVSLVNVLLSLPEHFAISVASYLRMVVSTLIFATLVYMSIRSGRDMKLFQGGIVIYSVVSIAIAGWQTWSAAKVSGVAALAGRFGGLLNGDTLSFFGVVPGLLILYAVIKRDDTHQSKWWVALLTLGLLGLFLNKSVGALFATEGAIAIYFLVVRTPKRRICISSVLKKGVLITCVITGTAVLVWFFRRADVESFLEFTGGSFTDHLVLAFAGLQLFLDNPLFGIGWLVSPTEAGMGSPAMKATMMAMFPELPGHFLRPASPHNIYIHFLAELGIIGFALFAYGCLQVGKATRKIVGNIPAGSPYKVLGHFYTLGLVFLLIFWTTHSFSPGDIAITLAFTFLASLASVARLERHRLERRSGRSS